MKILLTEFVIWFARLQVENLLQLNQEPESHNPEPKNPEWHPDNSHLGQHPEQSEDLPTAEVPEVIDQNYHEYLELQEEFLELFQEVQRYQCRKGTSFQDWRMPKLWKD